jgi:acetate kinase
MDDGLNSSGDDLVSAPDSRVDVLVIPADEERAVAAELLSLETI